MNTNNEAVYLGQLSLEDIACFGPRQTLDLTLEDGHPARWTLVLGDNGTGKTTLLRVLAGVTPCMTTTDDQRRVTPWLLTGRLDWLMWRSPFEKSAKVEAHFLVGDPLNLPKPGYHKIEAALDIDPPVSEFTTTIHRKAAQLADVSPMVCYGYGATRRAGKEIALSQDPSDFGSTTLFSDDAGLINIEEWLLQADYAALKAEGSEAQKYRRQFEQVKQILIEILPDVESIRIQTPEKLQGLGRPIVLFGTPYGEVPFRAMGLGYQTMIAWMVDLAARMMRRWPDSKNPITEPAVVLVDEIDLHLHPIWQRQLMGWLSERFTNTQFIVTAHSPLVVQSAADAKVVVLRREGDHVLIDQETQAVDGWRVDQLLTSNLFGLPTARPARYDDVIEERKELLSKQALNEADEHRLRELDALMSDLPGGETEEDISAMEIIRRAAAAIERHQGH